MQISTQRLLYKLLFIGNTGKQLFLGWVNSSQCRCVKQSKTGHLEHKNVTDRVFMAKSDRITKCVWIKASACNRKKRVVLILEKLEEGENCQGKQWKTHPIKDKALEKEESILHCWTYSTGCKPHNWARHLGDSKESNKEVRFCLTG